MRVLYIGNVGPGSVADFSTENDVARAFTALGWTVDSMREQQFCDALVEASWFQVLVNRIADADLVLYTMTQGLLPNPGRAIDAWEIARTRHIPTAAVHLDVFYGLSSPKDAGPQRCELPAQHPMFRMDYVFTADGSNDDRYLADGVNHHWLPPAVRHDEARVIPPTDDDRQRWGSYSVAFVGSTGYHPEWPHRNEMVDRLADYYGDRFIHVGNGGEPVVRGESLNRLYATVPVIVGDSCFAHQDVRYWSDRFPEVWGRGGFLVFPRIDALAKEVGRYPAWQVGRWDDMLDMTNYYLAHTQMRNSWREVLQPLIRADHTYLNRVVTILQTVGLR